MSTSQYVACDFGAESGRLIRGELSDSGSLTLQEVHRFANRHIRLMGHLYWDLPALFQELKDGLSKLAAQGHKDLQGIGVDTWGVDFGFLDRNGELLGLPCCYRDSRTFGIMEEVFQTCSRERIYKITGLQFLPFNSIFQLFVDRQNSQVRLKAAETMLFMPDLFNYFLTGEKVSEYTIASTSQLLDADTRTWSDELFEELQLPRHIAPPILAPGTELGPLHPEVVEETGIQSAPVILPACHDTGSAVVAVPARGEAWAYLSSGTWSLLGVEIGSPVICRESLARNFTNEGGYGNTIRLLKNIMGMWLLESCRRNWSGEGRQVGYDEILREASRVSPFRSLIDPDDPSFLNPPDMPRAIADYCVQTDQPAPRSAGEFARVIFESLALKYRYVLEQAQELRGMEISRLHVVGGGSRNRMLNQYTADALGIPVLAGPVEATAIGNILVQAIAGKEIGGLEEARKLVAASFELTEFEPGEKAPWDQAYERLKELLSRRGKS